MKGKEGHVRIHCTADKGLPSLEIHEVRRIADDARPPLFDTRGAKKRSIHVVT